MKKIISSIVAMGICGLCHAVTIDAPNSLVGKDALNGTYAYAWGIAIAVPTGQQVSSMEIDFNNITLTASGNSAGTGYLYTDLIDYNHVGVTTITDNDAAGDAFAKILSSSYMTSLGTEFFPKLNTALSWSYVLTGDELTALNSYLTAGAFNIGIDPDCHFTVGGISVTYTLGSVPNTRVPDIATTALLLLGSLSLVTLFRRKFALAK